LTSVIVTGVPSMFPVHVIVEPEITKLSVTASAVPESMVIVATPPPGSVCSRDVQRLAPDHPLARHGSIVRPDQTLTPLRDRAKLERSYPGLACADSSS
jgi:hypothetical protein